MQNKMNGECKRPLEHSISSQPLKYLRQSAADQQAPTRDASTRVISIQAPVVINSVQQVTCDVLHLDTPALQSSKGSGSDMPDGGGTVGYTESGHGDMQGHTGHKGLQSGIGWHMAAHEASTNLWAQESALDRALNVSRRQSSFPAVVGCSEPSVVGELVPKHLMERARDGRQMETQVQEGGIAQDEKTVEHDREENRGNHSSGTEAGHVNSASYMQIIKRSLEAQPLSMGRPLLVRMGEKEVNLLSLYRWVNIMGGYKKVTDCGSWATISDSLGLGRDCGPGVKLVYAKYVATEDAARFLGVQTLAGTGEPSAPYTVELASHAERKENYEDNSSEEYTGRRQALSRDGRNHAGPNRISSTVTQHDCRGQSAEVMSLHEKSLVGMIGWLKDTAVGLDTSQYRQSGMSSQEQFFRTLARRVRSVLWMRREELRTADGVPIQARQLPSPAVYYEDPAQGEPQPKEKLRTTRERLAHYGSQSPFPDHQPRTKRVPVGSDFQAFVKPWSSQDKKHCAGKRGQAKIGRDDETQSSDEESSDSSRWLGSRVWPPSGGEQMVNKSRDGRGREPTCLCPRPGSLECVRLHIETGRQHLKGELGQAFQLWGFDQVGEGVATNWTRKEEKMFKALVRLNPPSLNKNFWDEIPNAFPGRSTSDLVSYYFNVFVLRRRAIQNRRRGEKIDSDDDETELFDSESDDDSSDDDSFHEDSGRGALIDASLCPMKATSLHNSNLQQGPTVTYTKEPDTAMTYQAIGDNGNGPGHADLFFQHVQKEVCCFNSERKGNHCLEEQSKTSQGKDSHRWGHLYWPNTPHLTATTVDPTVPTRSALLEGQNRTGQNQNYRQI